MTIAAGTIVTILDTSTSFWNMQGVLKEAIDSPNQEVKVEFGKEYSYVFGFEFSEEKAVVPFKAYQLNPESDFNVHNRVKRMFGSNFLALSICKDPFNLANQHDCQQESCTRKATRRILVNIWGIIHELETCDECAKEWDGQRRDFFAAKGGIHFSAMQDV